MCFPCCRTVLRLLRMQSVRRSKGYDLDIILFEHLAVVGRPSWDTTFIGECSCMDVRLKLWSDDSDFSLPSFVILSP
jgi:hypothetical protein